MALCVVLTAGVSVYLSLRYSAQMASPDRLAFVAGTWGDGLGLYWATPKGKARSALTNETGDMLFPSWSPDGEALLCVHGSVYSRLGDGNTIVYLLHFNDAGQVKQEQIYFAWDGILRLPLWSPDGTRIALLPVANATSNPAETTLLLIDMAARQRPPEERTLSLRITGASASWSADGQRLALIGSAPGLDGAEEAGVYVYDLESARLVRIAPAASEVAWSPSAPLLACANLDGQPGLTLLNADGNVAGTAARPYVLENPASVTGMAWSPDGSRLVVGRYADAGGEVLLYDLETGAATTLATALAGAVQYMDWSPSGDYLAYTVLTTGDNASDISGRIEVLDMRTRQPVPFSAVEPMEAMPVWRPLVP